MKIITFLFIDKRDFFLQNSKSLKNEFEIYLESYLLRLCRYNSFDRLDACELLKLVSINLNYKKKGSLPLYQIIIKFI